MCKPCFSLFLNLFSNLRTKKEFGIFIKKSKNSFQYVKILLPPFRAVVKFCSTNRLFNFYSYFIFFNNFFREQPLRMCKNISSKINCESAIGQHLIANPECAKTCTGDTFRIIGQARSSFHLGILESVDIKTQNPVLCRQKEFVFSLSSSTKQW